MKIISHHTLLIKSLAIIVAIAGCAGIYLGLSFFINFDTVDMVIYFKKVDLGSIFFSNVSLFIEMI